MASKHLKKTESAPQQEDNSRAKRAKAGKGKEPEEPQGRHAAAPAEQEQKKRAGAKKPPKAPKPSKASKAAGKKADKAPVPTPEPDQEEAAVQAVLQVLEGGAAKPPASREQPPAVKAAGADAPEKDAGQEQTPSKKRKKPVVFRRDRAKKTPDEKKPLLSHRDAVGAIISLTAAVVLLAAAVVIWFYRDSFSPDGLIYSADTKAVAKDEYIFDAGSGEAFAAAGRGLAVANASGLELLDGSGTPVTSMLMQMESPTAAGCDDFAVFYDLGGKRMAVAKFDGTVEELSVPGEILSATVSESGYIALTTEYTGFRALVTVYDPQLEEIYRWYSSSAWVISANVSPDGRKLAVLSYTATGSEVRFFNLSRDEQQSAFSVSGTILLDMHWFTSNQLCAISSDQALFFNADGEWLNTYGFSGQYLIGYTFDGGTCASFALSPYRAGTTATLVSLDPSGSVLGTVDIQSELVCLTAKDLEIMALCSDGAVLYNSSLAEKGRLPGLTGFKYGLLRARGEALLIASNYAEVYTF